MLWLLLLPLLLLRCPAAPPQRPGTEHALLVQPNIDTEMAWTHVIARTTGARQLAALLAIAAGARLIVWPEVPGAVLSERPAFRDYARRLPRESHATFCLVAWRMTPRGSRSIRR